MSLSTNPLLKSLLGGKTLSLKGDGSKPGTEAYTTAERLLCAQIATTLLMLAEVPVAKPKEATGELVTIIESVYEEGMSVANWARAAFRAHIKTVLAHNVETPESPIIGFPKMRDPTSIQHLFRHACQEVGLTSEQTDGVFPPYGKKEEKKTA